MTAALAPPPAPLLPILILPKNLHIVKSFLGASWLIALMFSLLSIEK